MQMWLDALEPFMYAYDHVYLAMYGCMNVARFY